MLRLHIKSYVVKNYLRSSFSILAVAALLFGMLPTPQVRADITRPIVFPIIGPTSFSNDFGAARVGHTHAGNDVFGQKGQPLIAAVDGVVQWVETPERGQGLGFSIMDADGYAYWYIHLNNDTPGTDDGSSRGIFAYAPDLFSGNPVVAGQLLGWMGDSGNAEATHPHLHFEIHTPEGKATNPFQSLTAAKRIAKPVVPPKFTNEILPYGQFTGGGNIATGDVDTATPGLEIVTAAGPGGGPQVRVFSASGVPLSQFFAFESSFRGGVDVSTGDTNADGVTEIIVASGRGRVTEVRVFTLHGDQLSAFPAYSPAYKGGAHVAAADVTGDGRADIITGPLRGGGPHVRVFSGENFHPIQNFFPYPETFRGGVDVAAYPATAATPSLIVTTTLQGGGPNVRIFNGTDHALYGWFFARDESNRAGIRVTLADVLPATAAPEIVAVPETKGYPRAFTFDLHGQLLATHNFLEPWWQGGYDVAAGPSSIVSITATPAETRRRTSVRWLYGQFAAYRYERHQQFFVGT